MATDPGPGWMSNPGSLPEEAKGKRVRVILANGSEGKADGGSAVPPGWAADGKGALRWTLTGSEFDVAWYRVL